MIPAPSGASRRVGAARARLVAVLLTLACGALGVIASTQTWFTVDLTGAAAHSLSVPGSTAVPILAPLSLAVLALGAALSIAGTVLRFVFGAIEVVIAAALIVTTWPVAFTHPVGAVARVVTTATGITGDASVAKLIAQNVATPWPYVTAVLWLVLVATGVFVLATARRWRSTGRRYRTDATGRQPSAGPLDAVESWDDLSRGEDPTDSGR
ncbi:MAG TPA: Trp biosynthesis-associated membrane protein [Microbacterium sp.]|uniref:Trp biosynthesis-associated membrane protein n=1 Tax=Microbacterium sp. TaxID=51671 RepID=UPI002B475694|nr:Trp biosynthesis-associated membrane protein [Microbacterium sp.]HKT56246.1 Trp biosynthesis-associated membrane protein [Microbacterium sp.]